MCISIRSSVNWPSTRAVPRHVMHSTINLLNVLSTPRVYQQGYVSTYTLFLTHRPLLEVDLPFEISVECACRPGQPLLVQSAATKNTGRSLYGIIGLQKRDDGLSEAVGRAR